MNKRSPAAPGSTKSKIVLLVLCALANRDADLTAGFAPADSRKKEWLALEADYGNGLMRMPEHRQQYEWNALRIFDGSKHQLTLFSLGYYGQSHEGNLVPIGFGVQVKDTVDPRQQDQTHTSIAAANDQWKVAAVSASRSAQNERKRCASGRCLRLFCLQASSGRDTMPKTNSDPAKIALRSPKSGLSDNSIGAIAYLSPLPAFFFLAIRRYNKRPYVRFHSWQSLVFSAFVFLFYCVLNLAIPHARFLGPRVLLGIWCFVALAVFLLWLWCVVCALNGKRYRLPIIGDWADEQAYR